MFINGSNLDMNNNKRLIMSIWDPIDKARKSHKELFARIMNDESSLYKYIAVVAEGILYKYLQDKNCSKQTAASLSSVDSFHKRSMSIIIIRAIQNLRNGNLPSNVEVFSRDLVDMDLFAVSSYLDGIITFDKLTIETFDVFRRYYLHHFRRPLSSKVISSCV